MMTSYIVIEPQFMEILNTGNENSEYIEIEDEMPSLDKSIDKNDDIEDLLQSEIYKLD